MTGGSEESVPASSAFGLVGLGLVCHLIGATLWWWLVDTPNRSGWYNKDFEQWVWAAGPLVIAVALVLGIKRGSVRVAALTGSGAAAALMVELAVFVAWALIHSE